MTGVERRFAKGGGSRICHENACWKRAKDSALKVLA
jgi:hypothetical protein